MEAADYRVERGVEGTDSKLAASVLGYGVKAAVRQHDRIRAAAWCALWRRWKTGRPLRKHRGFYTFMEGGVDDCPDCVSDMDRSPVAVSTRLLPSCSTRVVRPPSGRSRTSIWSRGSPAQHHPDSRLFAWRGANRAWYIDLFRSSVVVFDGQLITASPVPFTLNPESDVAFVPTRPDVTSR